MGFEVYAIFIVSVFFNLVGLLAFNTEGASFQLMDEFDVSLKETDYLVFDVRSCAASHLLLMQDKTNFQTELYEIIIDGRWNSSESTINKGRHGLTISYPEQECDSVRSYWITWGGSTVHVGTGIVAGDNEFMSYNDSDPIEIKHVSVSPSYWVFYSSTCACCSMMPRYCQGLQNQGITKSGVYSVKGAVSEVYCDMGTDDGGWLVFQRRKDGSVKFYRGWDDYENGFGDLDGEFWLGNRYLSMILSEGHYELRIDLEDCEGNKRHAKYQTFIVGNTWNNYKLTVCGYSGDAGDAMKHHNGRNFTTKDIDNDEFNKNCAIKFEGAWWYGSCHRSNLNGLYLKGNHTSYANGVNWKMWTGQYYSLKMTEMKIREVCK